ncbi:MAG: ABC transporter ATP-binding protein [Desulfurococcaceae archaeon]
MAGVRLVHVTKSYGKTVAVNDVSFEVRDGEFFALLGPSGCGKTTTLRLIAGLEFPDSGEIYIGDRLVNDVHPRDRDVAMVFQNYALYPHMTVYDNIAFPLVVRRRELKLSNEEIRKVVVSVAKMLGIEEHLGKYPSQLSGGQQQRVALARALVRKPKVWLLDEPLSNLDAKLRVQMRVELKKLQMGLGITTVYVTHDQVEAMSMADRIAVMNEGRIMQIGTPSELYGRPQNTFVATFVGSPPMNLLPCELARSAEELSYEVPEEISGGLSGSGKVRTHYLLKCGELSIPLDPEIAQRIEDSGAKELLLGVRPEHIAVGASPPAQREIGVLEAKVEVLENLGSESFASAVIGNTTIRARLDPSSRARAGDRVYLAFDLRRALVFDGASGKLIV